MCIFQSLFSWLLPLLALLLGGVAVGCAPQASPAEFAPIVQTLVEKIEQDGILDEWVANARMHGLNPGIRTALGVETYGIIALDGVDVDVGAETHGGGTGFASGTVQALTTELAALGARTDPEAMGLRQQILSLLTGQATPSMLDVLERLEALEEAATGPPDGD